ncbi:unnamed protein product, partial [Bubo scandiacus]
HWQWPGPASWGKGKSGRCCRCLSFARRTRRGMLEGAAPRGESQWSLEPGLEVSEWGRAGPVAAT